MEDDLVRKVRKVAAKWYTTLTAMIRQYLEKVAAEDAATVRKKRERAALERTFEKYRFKMGRQTWKRPDLYERS